MNKIIYKAFMIAVLAFVLPIMIYSWMDRFKNPEFYAPIKLDYDKKKAELQQILDTVTVNLPPFDNRDDFKRTDAQSISITYHYHNPKASDIETLLENIQKIADDVELSEHNTAKHSFYKRFCVGENEISVGDYNFDNLYHVSLYVSFYKYDDCRRWVYESNKKKNE
ncbi:hypothetical protein [Moraxella sp. RCAD0137]|uniref:hypothetical protein n=1 Tax=Moraxella sp. RCAD0137 TaxID=1775913 RepID=UPI000C9FE674|nr:hypothetical protein [Moraxella sp. RCAD0137]PNP97172.1 hypothetical protein AZ602_08170 [Moraxella sp. RCAD0137]